MPKRSLLSVLARSFMAGEPNPEQIIARASQTLGRSWRWLRPLARRYVELIAGKTRPRHRDVVEFILRDPSFERAWSKHSHELPVEQWVAEPQKMHPVRAAHGWDIPVIESVGALADWFWLEHRELEWFADLKGLGYKKERAQLRHYHYRILAKRSGSIRLIEAAKPRLKRLQREILAGILEKIPPHPAAHGFLKGRSIKTFTAPHVGQRVVLRMDIRDFFTSFAAARIQTFFRTLGYPEAVADLLGGICTNAAPYEIWNNHGLDIHRRELQEARKLYSRPHLPQGAPTSPALGNLCAFRVDCRLTGLAKSADAEYTRYADDLAFSGGEAFERHVGRFSTHVAAILLEEGFTVRHRKTRVMRQGVRQHLAGVVINQRMNVMRTDFDPLKATLTNCVRLGPENQNHDAHRAFRLHLDGRVGFVEMINPAKGKRLRTIFEQIQWP
jgi:hypothetical protein